MARPQDSHLWALVQAGRAALAEDLAALSAVAISASIFPMTWALSCKRIAGIPAGRAPSTQVRMTALELHPR